MGRPLFAVNLGLSLEEQAQQSDLHRTARGVRLSLSPFFPAPIRLLQAMFFISGLMDWSC